MNQARTNNSTKPATANQTRYILKLLRERQISAEDGWDQASIESQAMNLTSREASAWIERLQALPVRPEVEAANAINIPFAAA